MVRHLFARVSAMIDLLCVQAKEDADRLRALGAPSDRIRVMGSVKYDMTDLAPGTRPYISGLLRAAGARETDRIVIGGSTWAGEEAALLLAHIGLRGKYPDTFLVLVPRHVERSRKIAADMARLGVRPVLRSSIKPGAVPPEPASGVLLVDSTGELKDFYTNADVVFVGKSLTRRGGQNLIEPAALGKPVIVGPHMDNFSSVMPDFEAAGAVTIVRSDAELRAAIERLLSEPAQAAEQGRRAREVVLSGRGAMRKTVREFLAVLSSSPRA